jgi:hypothetical protein
VDMHVRCDPQCLESILWSLIVGMCDVILAHSSCAARARLPVCLLDMHIHKVDTHRVWTCGRYPWDAHPVLWIARGSVVHQGLQMQTETAVTLGQSWTKVGPRQVKNRCGIALRKKSGGCLCSTCRARIQIKIRLPLSLMQGATAAQRKSWTLAVSAGERGALWMYKGHVVRPSWMPRVFAAR